MYANLSEGDAPVHLKDNPESKPLAQSKLANRPTLQHILSYDYNFSNNIKLCPGIQLVRDVYIIGLYQLTDQSLYLDDKKLSCRREAVLMLCVIKHVAVTHDH